MLVNHRTFVFALSFFAFRDRYELELVESAGRRTVRDRKKKPVVADITNVINYLRTVRARHVE